MHAWPLRASATSCLLCERGHLPTFHVAPWNQEAGRLTVSCISAPRRPSRIVPSGSCALRTGRFQLSGHSAPRCPLTPSAGGVRHLSASGVPSLGATAASARRADFPRRCQWICPCYAPPSAASLVGPAGGNRPPVLCCALRVPADFAVTHPGARPFDCPPLAPHCVFGPAVPPTAPWEYREGRSPAPPGPASALPGRPQVQTTCQVINH